MTPQERGRRIRAARKALGMSQLTLSQKVGISSQSPMSLYEAGTREMSIDLLRRIAEVTNTPLEHFIGEMTEPVVEAGSELGQMLQQIPKSLIPDLIAYGKYLIWKANNLDEVLA